MPVPRPIQAFIRETRSLTPVVINTDPGDEETPPIYKASHNEFIIIDGDRSVELPEPIEGTNVVVKTLTGAPIDIEAPSGSRVDGTTSRRFNNSFQALSLISDGDVWETKEEFGEGIEGVDRSKFVLADLKINQIVGDGEGGTEVGPEVSTARLGQTVQVSATLFNGGTAGADSVDLTFSSIPETEGETVNTIDEGSTGDIALDAFEQTEVTFTVDIDQPLALYNVTLSVQSSSVSKELDVIPPVTNLPLSNAQIPTDVTSGDNINISVDVDNEGETATDIPIELSVSGPRAEDRVLDTIVIDEIEYLGSDSVTFNYTVDIFDNAPTLTISSPTDSISQQISITFTEKYIDIEEFSSPSSAYPGEELQISAVADNLGPATTGESVDLILNQGEPDQTIIEERTLDFTEEGEQQVDFTYIADLPDDSSHTIGIYSEDASDQTGLSVAWPDTQYTVSNLSSPGTAQYGEIITVTADVENTGEPATDIPVDLNFGNNFLNYGIISGDLLNPPGRTVDTITIPDLDIFSPESISFDVQLDIDDIEGEGRLGVFAPDTTDFDVDSTSHFSVSDINVTSGIPDIQVNSLEGPSNALTNDTVTYTAEVENIGEGALSNTIQLRLEDSQGNTQTLDSTSFAMLPGEVRDVSLSWTVIEPAGSYTVGIFSDDDSMTQPLNIEFSETEPLVQNFSAPGYSFDGDTINVTADIFNIGDPANSFDVELILDEGTFDERVLDTQTLTADFRTPTQVSFSYTTDLDFGDYTIGIHTSADGANGGLTIPQPFINVLRANPDEGEDAGPALNITDPAFIDDSITVSAPVNNEGPPVNADIELLRDGTVVDTQTLSFAFRETKNVSFNFSTAGLSPGGYSFTIRSEDSSQSAGRTLQDVEDSVQDFSTQAVTYNGEALGVSGTVRNDGKPVTGLSVELILDEGTPNEQLIDSTTVDVGFEETAGVNFTWNVAQPEGTNELTLRTPSDSQTNSIDVIGTNINVSGLTFPDPIVDGDEITVSANVENIGAPGTDISVRFLEDGSQVNEQLVDLGHDVSQNVSYTYTPSPQNDVIEFTVESEGSYEGATTSQSGVALVDFQAFFVLVDRLDAPLEAFRGEDVTVAAELSNIGQAGFGITIDLIFDEGGAEELQLGTRDIQMGSGETRIESFDFNVEDINAGRTEPLLGEFTIGIFSPNGSATQTFTLRSIGLQVSNLVAPDKSPEGENFEISADITNNGADKFGTPIRVIKNKGQNGSEILASQAIDIAADTTQSVNYILGSSLAEGDYTIGIYTEDDGEQKNINIAANIADFEVTITDAGQVQTDYFSVDITDAGVETAEANFDVSITNSQLATPDFQITSEGETTDPFYGVTIDGLTEIKPTFDVTVTNSALAVTDFQVTSQDETTDPFYGVTIDGLTELQAATYEATVTNSGTQ